MRKPSAAPSPDSPPAVARGLCVWSRPPPPVRGSSGLWAPAAPSLGPRVLRAWRPLHTSAPQEGTPTPQSGPDAAAWAARPASAPGIPPRCTSTRAAACRPAWCEPPVSLSERRVDPSPVPCPVPPAGSRPSDPAVSAPWGPRPAARSAPFLDFRAPAGHLPGAGLRAPAGSAPLAPAPGRASAVRGPRSAGEGKRWGAAPGHPALSITSERARLVSLFSSFAHQFCTVGIISPSFYLRKVSFKRLVWRHRASSGHPGVPARLPPGHCGRAGTAGHTAGG